MARSYIPDGRLSEDIDLIALDRRSAIAQIIEQELVRRVRREYPDLAWDPPLTKVRDTQPAVLRTPDGSTVRIQLLDRVGYEPWPTEPTHLVQRYTDAGPARLLVPTRAAFAAWKTVAWNDRRASRDLYDLWTLAHAGAIDSEAATLFARHGPTNHPPDPSMFTRAPSEPSWRRELSGQTRLQITATQALREVRSAVNAD